MATITALTSQKRNVDRINVFLDDEFAFGLTSHAAVGLRVGQTLSPAEISVLQNQDEIDKARQKSIDLIARRPRSVDEIRRYLRTKELEEPLIDQVIDNLLNAKLLDDEAFVSYWIEQRETFNPRSQLAIRQELGQKGISRELVDAALLNMDEFASARRVAEKKARQWTTLPKHEFKIKLGRFLQQRGFNYEVIRETTDAAWQALSEMP